MTLTNDETSQDKLIEVKDEYYNNNEEVVVRESSIIENNTINRKDSQYSSYDDKDIETKLFEEITEEIGYGSEQFLVMFISGLNFMLQGIYYYMTSALATPMKQYYNIDNFHISIASAMVYPFGIITSLLIGFMTNKFGRMTVLSFTTIVICICHILMILINSYISLCINLFIIGGMININSPLISNILTEYLPTKNRGLTFHNVYGFTYVGNILILLITFLYMPEYDENLYYNLLWFFFCMPSLTLIITFVFLNNSPRALIYEKKEQGFIILSKMYKKTKKCRDLNKSPVFTDKDKVQMISELHNSLENQVYKVNPKEIFLPLYLKLTLLLMVMWTLNYLICNGPYFLLSVDEDKKEVDLLKSQLIVCSIGLLSSPVGGYISETELFGRKHVCSVSSFIISMICIAVIFNPQNVVIYLSAINFCNTASFNSVVNYTSEVYPTRLRDFSGGYFNSFGNFGATITQPLYLYFGTIGDTFAYIITSVFSAICLICCIFLPYETRGKYLDIKRNK